MWRFWFGLGLLLVAMVLSYWLVTGSLPTIPSSGDDASGDSGSAAVSNDLTDELGSALQAQPAATAAAGTTSIAASNAATSNVATNPAPSPAGTMTGLRALSFAPARPVIEPALGSVSPHVAAPMPQQGGATYTPPTFAPLTRGASAAVAPSPVPSPQPSVTAKPPPSPSPQATPGPSASPTPR